MTARRGPIVVDTDVFGSLLTPESELARRYDPLLAGRPAVLSFQTVAQLRFGAARRRWGATRMRRLEAEIGRAAIVHSGTEILGAYVDLRVASERAGHALGQREHDADVGSPPPPSASAFHLCPTIASSKALPVSASSQPTADRASIGPSAPQHGEPANRDHGSCRPVGSSNRESVTNL